MKPVSQQRFGRNEGLYVDVSTPRSPLKTSQLILTLNHPGKATNDRECKLFIDWSLAQYTVWRFQPVSFQRLLSRRNTTHG